MTRQVIRGKALQKAIIDLAHLKQWKVAHFPPIRVEWGYQTPIAADARGFPDLLLVRDKLIVAEIKGDGDYLKPEQEAWLQAFRDAGIEAYVWTPAGWAAGMVELALA